MHPLLGALDLAAGTIGIATGVRLRAGLFAHRLALTAHGFALRIARFSLGLPHRLALGLRSLALRLGSLALRLFGFALALFILIITGDGGRDPTHHQHRTSHERSEQ
ncbi:MAG: hypothetical protein ABI867_01735 [Kofleriaceae bacterium]